MPVEVSATGHRVIGIGARLGLSTDLNAARSLTLLEQQVLAALQQ